MLQAAHAHQAGEISYDSQGNVQLRCPALATTVHVPPQRQYSCAFPTLLALDKALSSSANSPRLHSGKTLREAFDHEHQHYLRLLAEAQSSETAWEPDYGSYVFDRRTGDLYLVAPEDWHRLALLTSNAKLLTDPERALTAEQIRERLTSTVVGFVGGSLGSNVVEGVLREFRPRVAKIADPDYLEATNLNRLQHGSLRYLAQPRSQRLDPKNGFETRFVSKVELLAYESQLIDPYMEWYLYPEGVNTENLDQFLLGDGNEPRLDYVVEEADDLRIKVEVRKRARTHGIPVLMASDLGHRSQVQLQDFAAHPHAPLGFRISDDELLERLERTLTSGVRADLFEFASALLGDDFATDEYRDWMDQVGEQPTSSLPQSGAIAQLSGALGAKVLAFHRLGHRARERVSLDTKHMTLIVD